MLNTDYIKRILLQQGGVKECLTALPSGVKDSFDSKTGSYSDLLTATGLSSINKGTLSIPQTIIRSHTTASSNLNSEQARQDAFTVYTFNSGATIRVVSYAQNTNYFAVFFANASEQRFIQLFSTADWSTSYYKDTTVWHFGFAYEAPIGTEDALRIIFYTENPSNYFTFMSSSSNILLSDLVNSLVGDDPYSTDDNQTPQGGYGTYDYTSETETPPQLPALSAAQVGFVSLWNPTQSEMQGLANYLWTGTFDLTNFKKLFTDPMECVLSVGIIPITPTREGAKREIVFGGSSHSGVNAYAVTEQFYVVDMGTLHITGMSQGALDYSPYAKASIYLPYCGAYALDVDEIMDSDISLEYHIDIYTGACVAYLTINGHLNSDGNNVNAIMYQFTGNVLASIPITGNDHSQFIQSMLFMGAAAAATVATSGAGAGAAAEAGADLGAETAATGFNKALAGSAINTVMSMKPNVLHSGNLSTTAGMLGGQKPFITMTWSNLCRPEDEYKLVGLPLHKSGTLSDFSGFTIVSACHMDNILCTDAELQMIEQALAKGVII